MMSIPRLHASEQRRLFEGKLAMDSQHTDDDSQPPAQTGPYREERAKRRAETFDELRAETGEPVTTIAP